MKYFHRKIFVSLLLCCLAAPSLALALEVNYDKLDAVTAVGINGRFVAFGFNKKKAKFEHAFNLGTMLPSDERLPNLSFKKNEYGWGEYSITFGTIKSNNRSCLEFRQLGTVIHELDWSNMPGERHSVCGFLKDGLWFTSGSNGVLEIYNSKAEKLASLEGHKGAITAVGQTEKWLISGDDKGLMILWDLDDIVKGKKRMLPYLSMVYAKNGEWAIWSEEGVFSSSAGGHQLLNVSKELLPLYRKPELLSKKITAPQHFHRLVAAELTNDKSIFNPPTVSLVKPPEISPQRDLEINAQICDAGGGIQSATLYLRGVPIAIEEATRGVSIKGKASSSGQSNCHDYTRVVSLVDGDNQLMLVANNLFGNDSVPDKAVVKYLSEKKKKPALHIATIAVTRYADKSFNLKYPVEDAKAVSGAFEKAGTGLFESIHTYNLFDEKVTRDGLASFFAQFKDRVNAEDVFILFIAGHGLFSSNSTEYYFLPYDIISSNILDTGIATDELMKLLSTVNAAQTLLLFDTCQSGGFDGFIKESQQVNSAQLKFVHRLGRASLMASSKEQVALEGVRGHGAFTSIILDALSGGADYTGDLLITVDELTVYISKHLPELTERKWGYRQEAIRNTTGHDFVLGNTSR
jgi:hypothetical protein